MFYLLLVSSKAMFDLQLYHYFIFYPLQFFPTAEESIDYYNQKRCVDGKGLILPSQIVSTSYKSNLYTL